jgi:predicted nucleic acid-binding protein
MIDYFDSSTLIAAVSEDDVEHAAASKAWRAAKHRVMYAHGLLEAFAVLSGGRHPAGLAPAEAASLIAANLEEGRVRVVQISAAEVNSLLAQVQRSVVRGGAIYDFMHVCAARKAKADRIFTLNTRHFLAVAPDLGGRILHPSEL